MNLTKVHIDALRALTAGYTVQVGADPTMDYLQLHGHAKRLSDPEKGMREYTITEKGKKAARA